MKLAKFTLYICIVSSWLVSCSNPAVLLVVDDYSQFTDEEEAEKKGGYYYVEEEIVEQVETGKVTTSITYPELTYYQTSEWAESSYGRYRLTQHVSFSMTSTEINVISAHDTATCVSGCNYEDRVIAKINGNKNQVFSRASSQDLKNVEDSSKKYNTASFISIFINSVKSSVGGFDYNFSKPVPFLIRNDLNLNSYKSRLRTPLSFSYNYTSTNPIDNSGSGTITISLDSISGSTVYVKVENKLDSSGNIKKDADRYGNFPFPKSVIYTIDTKTRKILDYHAETEEVVSQFDPGNASRYCEGSGCGQIAPTTVDTKLCKYEQNGETERFNCK